MPSDDESGAISDDGLSPIRGNSGAVSLCSVRDGGVTRNAVKDFKPRITEFPVVFLFQHGGHGFAAIAKSWPNSENTAFFDV